ncbi:hypothetical protein LTR53_017873, partial [Teratosphaeriaceae sp. CCFEE 6253]
MMLQSGRADLADGVAHLQTLLFQHSGEDEQTLLQLVERLEDMIQTAQTDLSQAVAKYPLHGLLTSLRYILEQDRDVVGHDHDLLVRFILCLQAIWDIVKPILCNDAPEGHTPEEAEDGDTSSTKDTLSYCWRALKESSMLLSTLLPSAGPEQAHPLIELCFTQLAELRHRGAFSTVAQTWIACCLASRKLSDADAQPLLQNWYAVVIAILHNKTTINTRRSAGLPSLICGILIAASDGQPMQQAFADLEAIAKEPMASDTAQEGSLPQVHALNCIKDVLRNSRLGEASEGYVPLAMTLAADALRSPAWAIRNCGLMLFRAVIDRLLGTNRAHLEEDGQGPKRLSLDQHPQLLELVLGLLDSEAPSSSDSKEALARSEGVFPALQLLQRLAVPEQQRPAALRAIRLLMASPSWHVRDKAARTYASLVAKTDVGEELRDLLQTSTASQNALHGALLGAKYLLRRSSARLRHAKGSVETDTWCLRKEHRSHVVSHMDRLYHTNMCLATKAAYIDLLAIFVEDDASSRPATIQQVAGPCPDDLHFTLTELHKVTHSNGSAAMLRLAV